MKAEGKNLITLRGPRLSKSFVTGVQVTVRLKLAIKQVSKLGSLRLVCLIVFKVVTCLLA